MGTNRRNSYKKRCHRCQINHTLCICDRLVPIQIETPVQVIMHFKELALTSNTVNLLKNIHKDCHIHLRGQKDNHMNMEEILKRETHTPLYLFPDDNSVLLTPEYIETLNLPINLIVPDGSWSQAKKFRSRIPELQTVQSIRLPSDLISSYKLRTPPKQGMLSSFEAISHCLHLIEKTQVLEPLLEIFDIFNKQVLLSRNGNSGTPLA